jgi:hypothetical protein
MLVKLKAYLSSSNLRQLMKTYQLTKMGEHHTNHCEDYTVVESLGPHQFLCAVMDGCTMGTDSYFAATLVGKLLRKLAIERNYQAFYEKSSQPSIEVVFEEILASLFVELKAIKSQLLLKDDELLTTLILMVVDQKSNRGRVIVVGDGLVCANGKCIEYDQDNRPDYLGYHLGEKFQDWYAAQTQILVLEAIVDVSISTDGIFTFATYDKKEYTESKDPVNFLLIDRQDEASDRMLTKKLQFLEQQCGLKPTDDLGIVRVIKKVV